jgi:hypothetical protein
MSRCSPPGAGPSSLRHCAGGHLPPLACGCVRVSALAASSGPGRVAAGAWVRLGLGLIAYAGRGPESRRDGARSLAGPTLTPSPSRTRSPSQVGLGSAQADFESDTSIVGVASRSRREPVADSSE